MSIKTITTDDYSQTITTETPMITAKRWRPGRMNYEYSQTMATGSYEYSQTMATGSYGDRVVRIQPNDDGDRVVRIQPNDGDRVI